MYIMAQINNKCSSQILSIPRKVNKGLTAAEF
uniref:Uncharacterized protein n=1 Tax=Anguilla anguilla TaxID=7936 RepID=A0A0E9QHF7_ANGAN